jgi:small subunit ribosomal protein S7
MPRKGAIPKREILADPIYNSLLVSKLINGVMLDGKKGLACRAVYGAMDIVSEKTGKEPLEMLETALKNIMPVLEVKSRRVGGANYQVPIEVNTFRRQTLGIRWMLNYARNRSERTIIERLAGEIMDAANNTGGAVKKKEDTHRMAEANKAFAHYRW